MTINGGQPHAVGDQGQLLVGGLGALQGGLQLAHQLGLLLEGVLAHVELVEQALGVVRHGFGNAHGQRASGALGGAGGLHLCHVLAPRVLWRRCVALCGALRRSLSDCVGTIFRKGSV